MQNYLVTSNMTALPWIHPLLKLFLMNIPKIADHVPHMPSLDGTLEPVLNIIIAIKFVSPTPIQFTLDKLYLVLPKKIITTATATNIIIATTKDLNAAFKQTIKNPSLPPYNTTTSKSLFKLDLILSNASYARTSQQYPIFKLPRVSTPKPVAAPPRVSPSTTKDFCNISPTTQKYCRDILSSKSKTSPQNHLLFLHHLNSIPNFTLALALLITLMLPLKP